MISVDLDSNDKSMSGSNNSKLYNNNKDYQITEENQDNNFKDDGYYWYDTIVSRD